MRKITGKRIQKSVLYVLMAIVFYSLMHFFPDFFNEFKVTPINQQKDLADYKEKDFVKDYCQGIMEYQLPDKTRVDCLTEEYAIEFDYAKKWAESIGQAQYYAKMTGKKPAVAIIMKQASDEKYIKRIRETNPEITIIKVKAYQF